MGENASGLKLKTLLSSMFITFHESSSRREDYELLTEALQSDYPLKFCSHRWVEMKMWLNVLKQSGTR